MSIFTTQKYTDNHSECVLHTGGKQLQNEGSSGSGLVTIVWKEMAYVGEYENTVK